MARVPRLEVPGVPLHIVQRGVDRRVCFAQAANYWRYLEDLQSASEKQACAVHAYVLMSNHVHLLVTPAETGAASRMMQQLGRRYVGYFNSVQGRTGTLWEGRFRSCLVDSDDYFLRCQRYIELNPVRAGMVGTPGAYRWSSYLHHSSGLIDPVVTSHAQYLALGRDAKARQSRYVALAADGLTERQLATLRECTLQGRAWGDRAFQQRMDRGVANGPAPRRVIQK